MTFPAANDDHDNRLMNELRIKDEQLTKKMYESLLDPDDMLNVLLKKLQLYNEVEASLYFLNPNCSLLLCPLVASRHLLICRVLHILAVLNH